MGVARVGLAAEHLIGAVRPAGRRHLKTVAGVTVDPQPGVIADIDQIRQRQLQLIVAAAGEIDVVDAGDPVLDQRGEVERDATAVDAQGVDAGVASEVVVERILAHLENR